MATEYKEVNKFLKEYGNQVTNEQKTRLRGFNKGGGPLEKSLKSKAFETKKEFGVKFFGEDYTDYVDKGVEGSISKTTGKGGTKSIYKYKSKMPPPSALDKWTLKKLNLRDKKGRFLKRKAVNFLVARSIWRFGIQKTSFFSLPILRSQKRLNDGVEKALQKDIETDINNGLK